MATKATSEPEAVTTADMTSFYDVLHTAQAVTPAGEIPACEAPRKVIAHLLQHKMKGFDDVGYILFQGVKVFEQGKREEAERKDGLTTEQKVFQGKA